MSGFTSEHRKEDIVVALSHGSRLDVHELLLFDPLNGIHPLDNILSGASQGVLNLSRTCSCVIARSQPESKVTLPDPLGRSVGLVLCVEPFKEGVAC